MRQVTQRLGALWQQWCPRYRAASRRVQVIIAVVVLVLICGVCGGLGSALGSGGNANSTPTAARVAQSGPTATATHPAAPTATKAPAAPAVLGATERDFIAAYGPSTVSASETRTHQGTVTGVSLRIGLTLDAPNDGGHVHFITLGGNGASNATMETVAKHFLPTDAKYVKDVQAADFGLEHVYMSAKLAKTFPADLFQDSIGNDITPGTFYVACGDQVDGAGNCSLNLGE